MVEEVRNLLQVVYWANFNECVDSQGGLWGSRTVAKGHSTTSLCFALDIHHGEVRTYSKYLTNVNADLGQIQRDSWRKKISEFTDSQVGWRRLVFGNLIHHCLSESLIGNSKTVTSNWIRFCVQVCHFVTDNRIYFPFVRGCVFLISFMVLFKDNTYIDFGKPDRLHFLSTMNNHSFCEREIPLRQRQLKLQNSCGSGWERTEWDGPSIIEKQNLIGAWRAQHSFLAHPQPQAMIRISRAYNFAGFWEPPVQRCICRLVQCIQEQVQVLCMHAPGQNVQRYICWLVVVCKMRLSAARSGSFENRQLYQWVAGISFSSIAPLNWN